MNKLLTIFTPVYNREATLPQLYKSLLEQSSDDFVWLLVDDGSTDNSRVLIERYIQEKRIDIKYVYQENKGKHVAHNFGVQMCKTDLFFCVDSDDYLTKDAVEVIRRQWKYIEKEKCIAGIVAYRGNGQGGLIGTEFPAQFNIAPLGQLYENGKTGDTALVFKTEVIKKFPFPEFPGEKFLRESVAYNEIDKHYSLYVLRKIIYICEYLNDGLTRNVRRLEDASPRGAAMYRYCQYQKSKNIKGKIGYGAAYLYFAARSSQMRMAIKDIGVIKSALLMPIVIWTWVKNKRKVNKAK